MPLPSPPAEEARRRAALRLLDGVLLLVLLSDLGGRFAGAFASRGDEALPPPLAVDLRTAPYERLLLLPGVGPGRARAILEDRRQNGPLRSVEDLARVPGIGPGTVRQLREAPEVRVVAAGADAAP